MRGRPDVRIPNLRCKQCGREVVGAQGASTHFRKVHGGSGIDYRGQFTKIREAKGVEGRNDTNGALVPVPLTTPKLDDGMFRRAEGVIVIEDTDGGLWIASKVRLSE